MLTPLLIEKTADSVGSYMFGGLAFASRQADYSIQKPIISRIRRGVPPADTVEEVLREEYNAPDPLEEEFAFWQEQSAHSLNKVLQLLDEEEE